MRKEFLKAIEDGFQKSGDNSSRVISHKDLEHLPVIVQKYLAFVGVIGKEKVRNVKIEFSGHIRSKPGSSWMKLKAEQVSFFQNPTRIFFLKAYKSGIPAIGLHVFRNEKASMIIKLAGLFKIVDVNGPEMNQAETVTHFNDMCLMAPATLIDKAIDWEEIDELTVKAFYKNGDIRISATLYFDENGKLINFISNDRYDLSDPKNPRLYPFSTPISEYKDFNGLKIPYKAKTVYSKPEGEFCYGEFTIKSIEHNASQFKQTNCQLW